LDAGPLSKFLGERLNGLSVAEGDTAFGQIVRGKLQRDAVTCQHADAVSAETASQVRQHNAVVFKLDAE